MDNDYFSAMREITKDQPLKGNVILVGWEDTPVMIDRQTLFDTRLSPKAKLVSTFLLVVSDNVRYGGDAYRISDEEQIADTLGMGLDEVMEALDELIEMGIVTKTSDGGSK